MLIKNIPSQIEDYFSDASNFKGTAEAVYFPESEKELREIVEKANKEKFRVTVAGARTGLTGSAVPNGGVLVSLEKMNKIIELNKKEKFIRVQPGVFLREIQEAVETVGLFYPPDPTERDSFIGGNVSTNASGAKTFKYGATRKYVAGLKIVLPDGDLLELERGKFVAEGNRLEVKTVSENYRTIEIPEMYVPRSTKNAAGYFLRNGMDAIDLFVGAEGTLGVITEIKLELTDLPEDFFSAVVFFYEVEDAIDFINFTRDSSYKTRKIKDKQGLDAIGIEFFDERALIFLSDDFANIPADAKAAVWFEQEITEENKNSIDEKWLTAVERFNGNTDGSWFAADKKDRDKFKIFRHSVSSKVADYISRKNLRKVGTDTAVQDEKFKDYYFYVVNLAESSGIDFIVYGHAGNSHLHLNFLPKDKAEFVKAKELYTELCRKAVEFNGTVSAEHGIGKIKREYLLMMYGEDAVRKMAEIKKQFDPNLILNIGNIIEEKYLL